MGAASVARVTKTAAPEDEADAPEVDAAHHSEDTTVQDPPTTEIVIGGETFQARAPKSKAYEDMASFVVTLANADEAEALFDSGKPLAAAKRRELEQAMAAVPVYIDIRDQFVRFLRWSLPKDERERLDAFWDDPDTQDIDSEDLMQVALDLFVQFQPYFQEKFGNIGFQLPNADAEAANRAVRRARAPKQAPAKAGAKKPAPARRR